MNLNPAGFSRSDLSTSWEEVTIQTPSGWNVIRLEDIRSYTPPPMKDIEVQLRQAAAREALGKYVTNLRGKANIIQ